MLITWPWAIDHFSFQAPQAFIFLPILPVLAGVYVFMQMQRRRYAVRYASVSLLREAVGAGPGVRRHIPAALYLCALAAMVVAMARPKGTVDNASDTGTVILCNRRLGLDVGRRRPAEPHGGDEEGGQGVRRQAAEGRPDRHRLLHQHRLSLAGADQGQERGQEGDRPPSAADGAPTSATGSWRRWTPSTRLRTRPGRAPSPAARRSRPSPAPNPRRRRRRPRLRTSQTWRRRSCCFQTVRATLAHRR